MNSIDELFTALGGPAKVGRAIGVTTEHAASMRRRESIPANYWPALIADASERGIKDITFEVLSRVAAKPRKASRSPTDLREQVVNG